MADEALRVVVVDDHAAVRAEVRRLVSEAGAIVVGEAGTAGETVQLVASVQPDVVMLDLDLPDANALGIIGDLRVIAPASRVVVLTASRSESDIRMALAAGAVGYLTKDLSGSAIISALGNASTGLTVVTTNAVTSLLSDTTSPRAASARLALSRLSPRELEVLAHLADGRSAAEAAHLLGISTRTVEGHARSILERLDARNRAEAVRIFVESGVSDSAS